MMGEPLGDDVGGWIDRQGTINGLGLVDLNFPQHFRRFPDWQADALQVWHNIIGLYNRSNITSFYGSSCANSGKDALTPESIYKRSIYIYI